LMDMARAHNKLDIELYTFAINEIFPKLCARAGFGSDDKVALFNSEIHDWKIKKNLCRIYNLSVYRPLCKLRH
ncbi:MAG TPA: hypothetical protein VN516_05030, partial [Candidatus Baltobacteraceae bacterium]|nr:hypothetical protein [Candidatus Baltobacteraceae bacterium]